MELAGARVIVGRRVLYNVSKVQKYLDVNVDPKVMQYVMGHSNIGVTMDVYNHITVMNRVKMEIVKLDTTMAVVQMV